MANDCPVGYTCPDIDEVLNSVESVLQTAKVIKDKLANTDEQKMSPDMWVTFMDEIKDEAEEIEHYLSGTAQQMEELRTANEKLREWGLDANNKVEELEEEVSDLTSKVQDLEEEVEGLHEANAGADL